MSNTLLKETELRSAELCEDGIFYKYVLQMKEYRVQRNKTFRRYSISATMIDNEGNQTEAMLGDVFSGFDKASAFFNKIMEYRATPLNLADVLEDEMA